jgi:hypothetical protein
LLWDSCVLYKNYSINNYVVSGLFGEKQLKTIEQEHIWIFTLLDLTFGSISTATLLLANALISSPESSLGSLAIGSLVITFFSI